MRRYCKARITASDPVLRALGGVAIVLILFISSTCFECFKVNRHFTEELNSSEVTNTDRLNHTDAQMADGSQSLLYLSAPSDCSFSNQNSAAGSGRDLKRLGGKTEPAQSSSWTAALPKGLDRSAYLEQVAVSWAKLDLPAAVEWFHNLPQDTGKLDFGVALAYEAARTDPITAIKVLSEVGDCAARNEALVHAVNQWTALDSKEATSWAEKVTDPVLRTRLMSGIVITLAESDGAGAAALASQNLDPGEFQDRAAVAVIQRWAQTHPNDAREWLGHFPDPSLREAAIESLSAMASLEFPSGVTQDLQNRGTVLH